MTSRRIQVTAGMGFMLVLAFALALAFGSVRVPLDQVVTVVFGGTADRAAWETIVRDIRMPRAITAAMSGAALGVAGLQMQTLFRNPLADPFTLGITSGAGLGVALVTLAGGGISLGFASGFGPLGALGLTGAAAFGAALVVVLVLLVSRQVENPVIVLVVGLMIGYAIASLVSMLIWFAEPERVNAYIRWGLGTFRTTTWDDLRIFVPALAIGLLLTAATSKTLNALLLGQEYAASMGVDIRRARVLIIAASSLLAGTVTAFAGPIGFIGIAIPHLARSVLATADHRTLVPACAILGATVTLVAEIIAQVPGADVTLPINAVTALIGAPVVAYVLVRARRRGSLT